MNKNKTVGLIFGGASEEHEVSCASAASVAIGLKEAGYDVVPIGISRSGFWYGPIPFEDIVSFDPEQFHGLEVTMLPQPGGELYRLNGMEVLAHLDVIFPIVHGKFGEDGRLQGFLDMTHLPYVGCGCAASAVGMDKVYTKDVLKAYDIDQTPYTVVRRSQWREAADEVLKEIEAALSYPLFVKPANGGSSVGISRADDRDSLRKALDTAALYDRKMLIETAIDKREIELAVLGNDYPMVSLPGEILADQAFYDYRSKYQSAASRTQVPADLSESLTVKVQAAALAVYKALDLSGLARVDFFLEKGTDRLLLNEVNTLPGFTDISMYAKMWAAEGKGLAFLLDELIGFAMQQAAEQAKTINTVGER